MYIHVYMCYECMQKLNTEHVCRFFLRYEETECCGNIDRKKTADQFGHSIGEDDIKNR